MGRKNEGFVLEVTEIEEFVKSWWSWWRDLWPTWRVTEGGELLQVAVGEADWTKLQLPGPNDMFSVLATIYWWGCAV